jgi:hypothetical protein
MDSEVEIWNRALVRLGKPKVQDPDEDSREAQILRDTYPMTRDILLERWDWPFARAHSELSPLDNTFLEEQWAYVYDWPDPTALAVRRLYLKGWDEGGDLVPYTIVSKDDQGVNKILSNLGSASARWTRHMTVVAAYPPVFIDTLSWAIQADIVMSLTKSKTSLQLASQYGARAEAYAKAATGNQEVAFEPQPKFIAARG